MADRCRVVPDIGADRGIEQPERHIDALDLFEMVFVGKQPRDKALAFDKLFHFGDCLFFGGFERDHQIRAQQTADAAGQHHGIAAKRTGRGCRIFVADDLAAAGTADIGLQVFGLLRVELFAVVIPLCVCVRFFCRCRLHRHADVFGGKRTVAIGAKHLLGRGVKFELAAAARTFEILCLSQGVPSFASRVGYDQNGFFAPQFMQKLPPFLVPQ